MIFAHLLILFDEILSNPSDGEIPRVQNFRVNKIFLDPRERPCISQRDANLWQSSSAGQGRLRVDARVCLVPRTREKKLRDSEH